MPGEASSVVLSKTRTGAGKFAVFEQGPSGRPENQLERVGMSPAILSDENLPGARAAKPWRLDWRIELTTGVRHENLSSR